MPKPKTTAPTRGYDLFEEIDLADLVNARLPSGVGSTLAAEALAGEKVLIPLLKTDARHVHHAFRIAQADPPANGETYLVQDVDCVAVPTKHVHRERLRINRPVG